MLSKIFGNKNSAPVSRNGHKRGKKSEVSMVSRDEYTANRTQTAGADRELYQYEVPTQSLGMSDLIKQHVPGERFLYAAVGGEQVEERDSRLRRLISYTPRLNKKAIPIENLPTIKLFKETENFLLSDIILKHKGITRPYVRIASTIVQYGALTSVDSEYTKIILSIMDNRMLNNKMAKSTTFSSNVTAKMDLSLDYCFPREESDNFTLTVSRENRFMEEGHEWGVLKLELVLEEMDFPIQTVNDPVVALSQVPRTLMEDRRIDPNNIDISITNNDRAKLAEIYMEGDLADTTEPVLNKTEVLKYAKSSLAGPKGKKAIEPASGEWSFMKGKRSLVNADQNSVDIEDEGSIKSVSDMGEKLRELRESQEVGEAQPVVLRSALKAPPGSSESNDSSGLASQVKSIDGRMVAKKARFQDVTEEENEEQDGKVKDSSKIYVFD